MKSKGATVAGNTASAADRICLHTDLYTHLPNTCYTDMRFTPTKAIQSRTPLLTEFCDLLVAPSMASSLVSSSHFSLSLSLRLSASNDLNVAMGPLPSELRFGSLFLSSSSTPSQDDGILGKAFCFGLDLRYEHNPPNTFMQLRVCSNLDRLRATFRRLHTIFNSS